MKTIPFQSSLRPAFTTTVGPIEYRLQCDRLDRIDRILTTSGLETEAIALAAKEHGIEAKSLSHKELENFAQRAVTALRSTIARDLYQLGFRAFSRLAADSDSVRKFLHLIELDGKKTTLSKSACQRHATFFSAAALRQLNDKLHAHLATAAGATSCELPAPVAYDAIFAGNNKATTIGATTIGNTLFTYTS